MKLAVFGKTGQMARALKREIDPAAINAAFFDRNDCDLSAPRAQLEAFVRGMPQVDVVIIAAAYTDVDGAETDRETAWAVNAAAPAAIAHVCKERNIPLIYISTDYVFDGHQKVPYRPEAQTNPLNYYGETKRAGEKNVLASRCDGAILRTSWVFDGAGRNFLTAIINRASRKEALNVIDDQMGRPTYSGHIAQAILIVARALHNKKNGSTGVFHITNTGEPVSWAGFARSIFDILPKKYATYSAFNEVSTAQYGTKTKRPAYSVLDVSKFEASFNHEMPDWRDGLRLALQDRAAVKDK